MSDKGVESLARALADNRSLQELSISDYNIGDNGIAHIATALQTNNTLKELTIGGETTSRRGFFEVLSLLYQKIIPAALDCSHHESMEYCGANICSGHCKLWYR